MLHNRPLNLTVATTGSFVGPLAMISLLALLAAALSPRPILLILLTSLLLVAAWGILILKICKVQAGKLTSVIFPDGKVRLQSNRRDTIGGFLVGQQWSTHRLAVLRISTDGVSRNLLILAAQQKGAGDFRRLNMWLRQDLFS
jgi:hypothetical protein